MEIVIVPSATPNPDPVPTAPVTLIVPDVRPVSKVKFFAVVSFAMCPLKLIFPLDVVVKVVFAPKRTN